jgi:hypothetical protein
LAWPPRFTILVDIGPEGGERGTAYSTAAGWPEGPYQAAKNQQFRPEAVKASGSMSAGSWGAATI